MADEEKTDVMTGEQVSEHETEAEPKSVAAEPPAGEKDVRKKDFDQVQDSSNRKKALDIDFLLDIPLNVNIEVGRSVMQVKELLQLGEGSVIEIDKQVGESFDIFANDKPIAKGEIVVVNNRFGVRITEILSPAERVQNLV